MRTVAQSLSGRGVTVEESTDGKGSPELIRRTKPNCVVLAVDLDAGQNGYILCKKLKSDDELKSIPVIIIGDPKGFAQHQKLKTRAEDYVGKPLAVDQLIEAVGKILGGFPLMAEPPAAQMESLDGNALLENSAEFPVEEVQMENSGEIPVTRPPDADFDMVDAMFDDGAKPAAVTQPAPPPTGPVGFDDDSEERTVVGFMPPVGLKLAPSAPVPTAGDKKPTTTTKVHSFSPMPPSSSASGIDSAESRELRAKVTELTGSLSDAQSHASELENRVRELETELENRQTELEAARSGTTANSKSDKEVFALKDSVNKKDKEILRLKSELNDKEKEIVELREKENAFDQQLSEANNESARKDAQLKTLQTKFDQQTTERKRLETQLTQAKEEARSTSAKLSTLQSDFDAQQVRLPEIESELESLRATRTELEATRQQLETDLSQARSEGESLRSQLDDRAREADDQRSQLEALQNELENTRTQVTSQAQAFADEISGLRQRIGELETETQKQEERANRSVERVKAHQEQAERVRQALQMAMGHLESPPQEPEEIDSDEIAEA